MKYQITLYKKGMVTLKHPTVEGKNHLDALKSIKTTKTWTHALVKGKTAKRYTKDLSLITVAPRFFKTSLEHSWCIMVMLGSFVEYHCYEDKKERDKIYEEIICTVSTPAASATIDKEPKNTTASIAETSDSKSGSTDPKISNGFVKHATWTDLLTRINTEKSSGKNKSKDSAEDEWLYGSKACPSKRNTKTLWATVLRLPKGHAWPGTNRTMKKMEGTLIDVRWAKHLRVYVGKGFIWLPKWLKIERNVILATVKGAPVHTLGSYGGGWVGSMNRYIGQTLHFKQFIENNRIHYEIFPNGGFWFAEEWLDFETPVSAKTIISEILQKEDILKHKMTTGEWKT